MVNRTLNSDIKDAAFHTSFTLSSSVTNRMTILCILSLVWCFSVINRQWLELEVDFYIPRQQIHRL